MSGKSFTCLRHVVSEGSLNSHRPWQVARGLPSGRLATRKDQQGSSPRRVLQMWRQLAFQPLLSSLIPARRVVPVRQAPPPETSGMGFHHPQSSSAELVDRLGRLSRNEVCPAMEVQAKSKNQGKGRNKRARVLMFWRDTAFETLLCQFTVA